MGKQADFNFDARPNLPGLTSLSLTPAAEFGKTIAYRTV
jgi:hypothetical protein